MIFGGLNASTFNTSDLYVCELDPTISRQHETEKNKKMHEFKKTLNRNKYDQQDD